MLCLPHLTAAGHPLQGQYRQSAMPGQDASLLQGTQVCPAQLFTWHEDPCKAPGKNFRKHSVTSVPLAIFIESQRGGVP